MAPPKAQIGWSGHASRQQNQARTLENRYALRPQPDSPLLTPKSSVFHFFQKIRRRFRFWRHRRLWKSGHAEKFFSEHPISVLEAHISLLAGRCITSSPMLTYIITPCPYMCYNIHWVALAGKGPWDQAHGSKTRGAGEAPPEGRILGWHHIVLLTGYPRDDIIRVSDGA